MVRLPEVQRQKLLHWLGILGKWSMLDVLVVAILIVLVKLGPLAKVEARKWRLRFRVGHSAVNDHHDVH